MTVFPRVASINQLNELHRIVAEYGQLLIQLEIIGVDVGIQH